MAFVSVESSVNHLADELSRAWGQHETSEGIVWQAAVCPAPPQAAARLLDLLLTEHSVYWTPGDFSRVNRAADPEDTEEIVGIGAVACFRLTGSDRFEEAQTQIVEAYKMIAVTESLKPTVRFFGGAAFNPGRDGSGPCWNDFGDACFVLPKIFYVSNSQGAHLVCLSRRETQQADLQLVTRVLQGALAESRLPESRNSHPQVVSRKDSAPASVWNSLVEDIKDGINGGDFEKVVTSRRVTLELSEAPQLSRVIERLGSLAPGCARFAMRVGKRTFVGATPERLVERSGLQLSTEALAGSVDRSESEAAELLLTSKKERQEHAFVVEAIRESLADLCTSLDVPDVPEVRTLKRILHLRTPIAGTLRADSHILSLVARLHPTPAVGGYPQERALRWIADHEQAARGWYAAPIGWITSEGDGEFVVALRSALICEDKVHIYAGAGIVRGSNAQAEYDETELKLSGMLGALGLTG